MKKSLKRKVLCLSLSVCLFATNIPGGGYSVFAYSDNLAPQKESISLGGASLKDYAIATDSGTEKPSGPAIDNTANKSTSSNAKKVEGWKIDRPKGKEVLEMDGDWIHFSSGTGNDNNEYPAVMLSETIESSSDGVLEFTVKSKSEPANTRFGAYIRYNAPKDSIVIGYDAGGWYWQVYASDGDYYKGEREAAPSLGTEAKVKVEYTGNSMDVYINNKLVFDDVDISKVPDAGSVGFRAGGTGSDVLIKNVSFKEAETYSISGKVTDSDNTAVEGASVSIGSKTATTSSDGSYTLADISKGEQNITVIKTGFETATKKVTVAAADITNANITLTKKDTSYLKTIQSDTMTVEIDSKFPSVFRYVYGGKEFAGQSERLTQFKINGKNLIPTDTVTTFDGSKATYVMTFKEIVSGDAVDAVITCELVVKNNTLEFNITSIEDNKIVKTIEIPNHNLLSVKSTDIGAQLAGSNMKNNTQVIGDVYYDIKLDTFVVKDNVKKGYMYAFLSNGNLSAGLWSNSENNVGGGDWQRVTSTAVEKNGVKEVALNSTYWTYQKGAEYRKEDGKLVYSKGGMVGDVSELPRAKVAIADDINGDSKIDWQDGAIAYRDIMNNPKGSEDVPELVAYRVNMSFGSQAQNPFLTALDGVKKVYLHTDGLGQSILLKGYGSEGHDSGHLNYADIGKRLGGTEDMKVLMAEGKEYGAKFGIHVNASETYPESKYFTEERLLRTSDYSYGWNWLDQGININADYDLKNGRASRFEDLYKVLAKEDGTNDLDFIYVDVWGNGQSGDNSTWPSHQLSKEITGLGWRLGGEWGHAFENESTFQHWAADLSYGGYGQKGINSNIARFIRNHQKDSWVGNVPAYGAGARQPLLGGYNMKDFEGWQGRSDYAAYINTLYEVDIPSKFVQHYLVTNWTFGTPLSVTDNGSTYTWTPDTAVKLKDEEGNVLDIARASGDYNQREQYITRIMTFNDKEIFKGKEGDSSYLIPWFWDQNGNDLEEADHKLYHWNTKGGETTWDVPEEWSGEVSIYELTDLGKTNEKTVAIIDGEITLEAAPATPYVVHKSTRKNDDVQWSDGMKIVDTGFNSASLESWNVEGDTAGASVVRSQGSNYMLSIAKNSAEVAVSQKITDLKPNTRYAALVGVDNRSDVPGIMEINVGDNIYSNSAPKSIAKNYVQAYAHNNLVQNATVNNSSYFQNMYVYFDTGTDVSNVTLTLKRAADQAATYFDDIRIVQNDVVHMVKDNKFVQDFEDEVQGIWPFVIGNVEGVTDNRTHLSEKNAPFTQIGWNGKIVNDVISGDWSVKTNGLTKRQKLVYQTIPQNFAFKPGVDYVVRFDYETGSTGTYAVVYNDKEFASSGATIQKSLESTAELLRTGSYGFTLTGADSGQTWFGIYSTDVAPDLGGLTNDGHINFRGYKDFILDNLIIEVSSGQKGKLRNAIATALTKEQLNYSEESWKEFTFGLKAAQDINANLDATQAEVDKATELLLKSINANEANKTGSNIAGTVLDTEGKPVVGVQVVLVSPDGKQYKDTTIANGSYNIAGGFFGQNTIIIDDLKYVKAQKTTTTTKNEDSASVDFTLTPSKTKISGRVLVADKAIEGAKITISADGVEDKSVVTDASGNYGFNEIIVKNYTVTVQKASYDELTIKVPTSKLRETKKDLLIQPETDDIDYVNDFEGGVDALASISGAGKPTFTSKNGKAEVKMPEDTSIYDTNSPKFRNGVVEAEVTLVKGTGGRFGLDLRSTDGGTRINIGTEDVSNKWFIEGFGEGGGTYTKMYYPLDKDGNAISLSVDKTISIKAEIVGKTITLWLNGVEAIKTDFNGFTGSGYAGFTNRRGENTVLIDNLKITSYDLPEGDVQNIVGIVVDSSGKPVSGADVKVISVTSARANAFTKVAKTNEQGEYKIKNVPFGQFNLTISKDGAQAITMPFSVDDSTFYNMVEEFTLGKQPAVSKAALINAISVANEHNQEDYNAKSWSKFTSALSIANNCVNNSASTKNDVDEAIATLKTAMKGLEKASDKTILDITINAVRSTLVESVYTKETWAVFKKALDEAVVVSGNGDATQEQIDKALNTLNAAVKGLVTELSIVDKSQLTVNILVAEKMLSVLKKADYTSDSWTALENALKAANECLKNENALQADVNKAISTLEAAMKGLKANSTSSSGGNSGGGSSSGGSGSGSVSSGQWKQDATGWWYAESNGNYQTNNWKQINGKWYYFNGAGYMTEGWQLVNNVWYYLQPGNGNMVTGWVSVGGVWYYTNASGAMQTGWVQVSGKWYFLNTNGSMLANTTTPDGFKVDNNGVWIQ